MAQWWGNSPHQNAGNRHLLCHAWMWQQRLWRKMFQQQQQQKEHKHLYELVDGMIKIWHCICPRTWDSVCYASLLSSCIILYLVCRKWQRVRENLGSKINQYPRKQAMSPWSTAFKKIMNFKVPHGIHPCVEIFNLGFKSAHEESEGH